MGCHVVLLSGSERKKAQALHLGAREFFATKDAKKLDISSPVNRLLVTAAVPPNWGLTLPYWLPNRPSIRSRSRMIPWEVLNLSLNRQKISVHVSLVAPRHMHRKMLGFAAQNQIKPAVETFPMTEQGIKQAMDKFEPGEVAYRAVVLPN